MSQSTAVRQILAIALEPFDASVLHDPLVAQAGAIEVAVVAPALNTRLRHWVSDEDGARAAADDRLAAWLEALEGAGVRASGWIGDADPMHAIADALAVFPADELVIVTPAERAAHWLARDLARRAGEEFSLPVVHVAVEDEEAERAARAPVAFCTFGARPLPR